MLKYLFINKQINYMVINIVDNYLMKQFSLW